MSSDANLMKVLKEEELMPADFLTPRLFMYSLATLPRIWNWSHSSWYGSGYSCFIDNSPPKELLHDHHPDCADPPLGPGVCGHYLEEQFQISLLLCNENKFFGFIYKENEDWCCCCPSPFFTCSTGTFKSLTTEHIFNRDIHIFLKQRGNNILVT